MTQPSAARLNGVIAIAACLMLRATIQAQETNATPHCRVASQLMRLDGLHEASGLAASRRVPGRLWSHNDSGDPVLVAFDGSGTVLGRIRLAGVKVEDWEALAAGPCADGSACLYVGDIGDNDAERPHITVYRFPEPERPDGTIKNVERIRATYPDRPHDAETLLVAPDGTLFVVTKGETGPIGLYRFPRDWRPGTTVRLERVGGPGQSGRRPKEDRITDGAISPDGRWVALRTNTRVSFFRASDLLAGRWKEVNRLSLAALGEPQGEAVTFAGDDTLYVAGEGGGKKRPGTLARLACTFGS